MGDQYYWGRGDDNSRPVIYTGLEIYPLRVFTYSSRVKSNVTPAVKLDYSATNFQPQGFGQDFKTVKYLKTALSVI